MGKERSSPVWDYFVYDPTTNKSSCLIPGCRNVLMKGGHASNLERHVQRYHPETFQILISDKQKRLLESQPSTPGNEKKRATNQWANTIDLTLDTLMEACVELVTVNGRPFSLIDDSGFRKLMDPLLSSFGGIMEINSDIVRNKVRMKAMEIKSSLQFQIEGKLVCLKIDTVTWRNRSLMAINIQYTQDGNINLHTLAVTQVLKKDSTNLGLSNTIINVLDQFSIPLDRVYSLTVDRASDITKLMAAVEDDSMMENSCNSEDEYHSDAGSELDRLLENLELTDSEGYRIRAWRCPSHTLHSAINEVINECDFQSTLNKVRGICRCLLESPDSKLVKAEFVNPQLDQINNWQSTLEMVSALVNAKDMCKEFPKGNVDLQLTDGEWVELEEMVAALTPAKYTVSIFEEEQLFVGDFYKAWLKCEVDTGKIGNGFAKRIQSAMKNHAKSFFQCSPFIGSLFLDPRFNVLLSEDDCKNAKTYLQDVSERISKVRKTNGHDSKDGRRSSLDEITAETNDDCDEIDMILKQKEAQKLETRREAGRNGIFRSLEAFLTMPRIPKDENLFQFWEMERATSGPFSELYDLASVVHAFPVTQVSIDRLSTSLQNILSPVMAGNQIDTEALSDLMIVRSNMMFASK